MNQTASSTVGNQASKHEDKAARDDGWKALTPAQVKRIGQLRLAVWQWFLSESWKHDGQVASQGNLHLRLVVALTKVGVKIYGRDLKRAIDWLREVGVLTVIASQFQTRAFRVKQGAAEAEGPKVTRLVVYQVHPGIPVELRAWL